VCRVYIGSFWNQPLHFDDNRRLFELEASDLFSDLQALPKHNTLRKLNDFIRRARLAKVGCEFVTVWVHVHVLYLIVVSLLLFGYTYT